MRRRPLNSRPDARSSRRKPQPVLPAIERVKIHTERGNADIVAMSVLSDLKHIPDSQKRKLLAQAADVAAKKAIAQVEGYSSGVDPKTYRWSRSRIRKAKTLSRSRKEGKALKRQVKAMYRSARHVD